MSYGILAIAGFTGNLHGNVTGNVFGTHFGNQIGNVTGNLFGEVRGNVFGNLNTDTTIKGNVTIQNNATILGNLLVSGNMTVINTETLKVEDNLIAMAIDNNFADIVDIGFYGTYNDGTGNLYTGLARDASDSIKCWKLFKSLATEPTQTIDFSAAQNADLCLGNLYASILTGNLTGNVTGNVYGRLFGDVQGNVSGNVFGDITSSGISTFTGNAIMNGNLFINGNSTEFHSFIGTTGNVEPSAADNFAFFPILNLPMIKTGTILSIAASASSHIGTGNMTLQPWVDIGTVVSPSVTLATPVITIGSGAGTDSATGNISGSASFVATNRIGVRITTSSDWNYTAATNTVTVLVRYKLNPT